MISNPFGIKSNPLEQIGPNTYLKLSVVIKNEYLYKNDSGFGIYVVENTDEEEFTIKGTFVSPLDIHQTYHVEGYVTVFRGTPQLSVNKIQNTIPKNKKGILLYLQTLKGLKTKAELIYNEFGEQSIEVLMNDPMKVVEKIKGIGKKSVSQWKLQLDKMKDSQDVIVTLLSYGLTSSQARKLYVLYNAEVVQRIQENPYFLAKEVKGYGFERCDRIARMMGFDPKSNFRIEEGVLHTLSLASQEGHCFLPIDELMDKVKEVLSIQLSYEEMRQLLAAHHGEEDILYRIGETEYIIPYRDLRIQFNEYEQERNKKKKEKLRYVVVSISPEDINPILDNLASEKRIVDDNDHIYLRKYFYEENAVAIRVALLSQTSPFKNSLNLDLELEDYCKENQIQLEEKQREAILTFAKEKGGIYILNGSAGCGKTFTLKIILEMLERQYKANNLDCNIQVFAPTGKASKVASKSTQRECVTVHRGLGYNPVEGFEYNSENHLEADVVVLDETSMLDISLTNDLLAAIKKGTKIIFLGDTKQLPSVGAGNVFKNLIESEVPTIVTLNVVKRQGALSGIIKNANNIIDGKNISSCEDTKDAYVIQRDSPEGTVKVILQSMKKILTFDGYELEDIQVLAPQRRGSVGTYLLNYMIQKEFNQNEHPHKVLNKRFDVTINPQFGNQTLELNFKKGDKVIHIKNNYDKEWFTKDDDGEYRKDRQVGITNGECGVIEDIVKVKERNETFYRIIVKYEGKYVFYDGAFEEIDHAWALTIHKSQGSQWKALIMPMMKQYFNMLDNNLFYTGYTRAELFNVVIGQEAAIQYAIKTHKTRLRHTKLSERIKMYQKRFQEAS